MQHAGESFGDLLASTVRAQSVHPRRWSILAILNLSLVIVVAGNSSLNVALPKLVRELDATHAELQWIVDVYALVFAGLLLSMGALGDRFGRKGLLQIGLVLFAVGALSATLGTEPGHLIASRGLMGLAAAMIMPATLSIITSVFPPDERARAIAVWAGFAGAGVAIGPLISGLLLEHFWYGSIFFINLPLIVIALGAGAALVPTSRDPEQRALDPIGAALSMAGLAALLYGIIQGVDRGWSDGVIVAAFAMATVALLGFVTWERRCEDPMLPMGLFSDRRFTSGAIAIGATYFALFGLFFVATQYLQFVLGYSPLEAGAASLPLAAMLLVAAPRSALLVDRFGTGRVVAAGMGLIAIGMIAMLMLSAESSYGNLVGALLVLGLGMGLAIAPATDTIMASMPLGKAGVGSAVNDTAREVGGSLGVAVLGSMLSSGYRGAVDAHLASTPPQVAEAVRESIGAAVIAAKALPADLAGALSQASRAAFDDGMNDALLAGAVLITIFAGAVFTLLRETRHRGEAFDLAARETVL